MAILALVLVPNLTAWVQKADDSKVKANMKSVHTAAEMAIQTNPEKDIEVIADAIFLEGEIAKYANLKNSKVSTTASPVEETYLIEKVKDKDGKDTGRINVTTVSKGGDVVHMFNGTEYRVYADN